MQISLFKNWFEDFFVKPNLCERNINEFTAGEVIYFERMLKLFLNVKDRSSIASILTAIQERNYSLNLNLKEKFIDIISESDDQVLDIAATTFGNIYNKEWFLLLLEALKAKNHSLYNHYVTRFVLCHNFTDNPTTMKYLSIINRDYTFLVRELVSNNQLSSLEEYLTILIPCLSYFDIGQLCRIISLEKQFAGTNFYNINYFNIINHIFNKCPSFETYNFQTLLSDFQLRCDYSHWCVNHYYGKIPMIVNYAKYLNTYYSSEYSILEEGILSKFDGWNLVEFSTLGSYFISKRKFLAKIVSLKDQGLTARFLSSHPEFSKLMPLL